MTRFWVWYLYSDPEKTLSVLSKILPLESSQEQGPELRGRLDSQCMAG